MWLTSSPPDIFPPSRAAAGPLRWGLIALFVVVSTLLTGCLKADVEISIDADGGGEVDIEVIPNSDLARLLREVDLESTLQGAIADARGAEFDTFVIDDRDAYRLRVPFDDHRDLEQVLVGGGSVNGQEVRLFDSFRVTESPEGEWSLDATILPLGHFIAASRPDGVPESTEEILDAAGVGAAGTGLDLTITLPGELASSNAARTSGGSATWRLDRPDAPAQLQMRTVPTEFPTTTQLILMVGGGALVLGIVLFVISAVKPHRTTREANKARRSRRTTRTASHVAASESGDSWAPVDPAAPSPSDRPDPLPAMAPMTSAPMTDLLTGVADPDVSEPGAPLPGAPLPGAPLSDVPVPEVSPPDVPVPAAPPPDVPVPAAPPPDVAHTAPVQPVAPEQTEPVAPESPGTPTTGPLIPAQPEATATTWGGPADLVSDPAGWYPDPTGAAEYRWWSGENWTDHTA